MESAESGKGAPEFNKDPQYQSLLQSGDFKLYVV